MTDNLLTRLLLDAQDEFLRVIDEIPAPGRGGPIGHLNAPGWIVAHLASSYDAWLNVFCAGNPAEPWADGWFNRIRSEPDAVHRPPLDEGRESFARIAESAAGWITSQSWDDLQQPATLPQNAPWHVSRAYMAARGIAHLYVHAGELSVMTSLMGAGDLGLPGPLPHSTAPTAEDDPSIATVAALLRDGYVEVDRAAQVTPRPAAEGAMDRLNSATFTLVHLAGREDRLWNVHVQGKAPSSLLAAVDPAIPAWDSARDALADVTAGTHPWLEGLDGPTAAQPMDWRGTASSVGAQMARSGGHFFSHAGEMMAHASLYGVADLGMPGELAHVAAAAPPAR